MTMEMDYTYIPVDIALQIKEDVMVRAVRVKSMVKDKLCRLYVVKEKTNEVDVSETKQGVSELVDETKDGLYNLNNKLNALEQQGKVQVTEKRAVLFTKALVDRIQKVNAKWFSDVETVVNIPVNEPNIGDTPISAEWQNMNEPTFENVVMPSVEEVPFNQEVFSSVNAPAVPEMPTTPIAEPVSAPVESETPVVEPIASVPVNEEISADSLTNNENPIENTNVDETVLNNLPLVNEQVVENSIPEENTIPNEIVNETSEVENEVTFNDSDFKLPSFESTTSEQPSTSEISIAQLSGEAINQDFVPEPKEINMEIEPTVEPVVEKNEERVASPLSKAEIFGKIQRINNTLKEKNSENETLREKLKVANENNSELKEKVNGFNDIVKDLNSQVSTLTQNNEQLKERNTELETKYGDRVNKLEAELEALKAQRLEDAANNRQALDDLRAKHADEIANINRENAKKIQEVNDSKDRQINAIYQTLSEALGGSYEEDNNKTI